MDQRALSARRVVSTLGLLLLCGVILGGVVVGAAADAPVATGVNDSTTVQGDSGNVTNWERTTATSSDTVSQSVSSATTSLIELHPPSWASIFGGGEVTQEPNVQFNRNVTFDGGSAYRIVVHDTDAGGYVTITPPDNTTVGPATDDSAAIYPRSPDGTVPPTAGLSVRQYVSGLNSTVTGSVSTSGIVNQSVALVDAATGQTVSRTNAQPYVVGYNRTVETSETNTDIEFSIPREPFPADVNVSVGVLNHTGSLWGSHVLTADASYDRGSDSFVASVDKSRLAPGNYSYEISFEHPMGIEFEPVAGQLNKRYRTVAPIVIGGNQTGISLPGTAGPARSVDADSLLEDVDGDGDFDREDALTYYEHRGKDVVRNNPARFDFDGDGTAGTVSDALALYEQIT